MFKAMLLASVRIAFFGLLKAALFIYILFLPDSPQTASMPEHKDITGLMANAGQGAAVKAGLHGPDALPG
jgi:hypothetical protein